MVYVSSARQVALVAKLFGGVAETEQGEGHSLLIWFSSHFLQHPPKNRVNSRETLKAVQYLLVHFLMRGIALLSDVAEHRENISRRHPDEHTIYDLA